MYQKYLKYKNKYLELKQKGGFGNSDDLLKEMIMDKYGDNWMKIIAKMSIVQLKNVILQINPDLKHSISDSEFNRILGNLINVAKELTY